MKFVKILKAENVFDESMEQLRLQSVHRFYKSLEKLVEEYKKLCMSKEDILSAIEEAKFRLEEDFEEI